MGFEERIGERIGESPRRSAPEGMEPIGDLVHDGPVTPNQLALYLPVTGVLDASIPATVRYKESSSGTWLVGHPLHRIRPVFASAVVADAFAGMVFDLQSGTSYDVEVTVGATVKTLTGINAIVTRSLPGTAGPSTTTISVGTATAAIQTIINSASPGDVIEFENGTHAVSGLSINVQGNQAQPIYIRGETRSGTILRDTSDTVVNILDCEDIIIENLTVEGSGVDSGAASTLMGISFSPGSYTQRRVTLRDLLLTGVDKGIVAWQDTEQLIIYDCTLAGNNAWTQANLESGNTWNDDGIRIPGHGNCAFNNRLSGFGDALSADVSPTEVGSVGVYFYRNDITNTCDDAFEVDDARRNIAYYDNRIHNSMTFCSADPIVGGPLFVFRNICVNTGRWPYKFNSVNTGHFFYNNTVIRTNGYGTGGTLWGWGQFSNGAQRAWGYRNNILLYQGTTAGGGTYVMESTIQDPIDFTHNGWYPNDVFRWTNTGGSFANLAAAYAGLPGTTPVFGGETQRHEADLISEAQPFETPITLDTSYLTPVTPTSVPVLDSASVLKYAGVAVPGVTDSYAGAAPDIGALIEGQPIPAYGDRNATVLSAAANALSAGEWGQMADHGLSLHYSLMYWSDSGVWNELEDKLMWRGAPGTCCKPSPDHRLIQYFEDTDTWTDTYADLISDGHAFDGNAIDSNGILYFQQKQERQLRRYNGVSWDIRPSDDLPVTGTSPGLTYFPELNGGSGGFVACCDVGYAYYSVGTSWVQIGGVTWPGVVVFAEYNPVEKVVFMGRGSSLYKLDSSAVATPLGSAPTVVEVGVTKVVCDPVTGKYIVYNNNTNQWYEFDIVADSWVNITSSMVNRPPQSPNYFMTAIPTHGATPAVIMLVNQNGNVFIYRHADQ